MTTLIRRIKIAALLCAISSFSSSALADDASGATAGGKVNKIEIKDFAFNPQKITGKHGQKIAWINRDEEQHTVMSAEKKFQRPSVLDTDQEFSITAGAPGTYE